VTANSVGADPRTACGVAGFNGQSSFGAASPTYLCERFCTSSVIMVVREAVGESCVVPISVHRVVCLRWGGVVDAS
jgi:hypothetical protein